MTTTLRKQDRREMRFVVLLVLGSLLWVAPNLSNAALVVRDDESVWDNGIVPFTVREGPNMKDPLTVSIFLVAVHVEVADCVRFEQVPAEEAKVRFVATPSRKPCSVSGVGKLRGVTVVNLHGCGLINEIESLDDPRLEEEQPNGQDLLGISRIVQLFLQVLGMFHEQRRLDRNDFVQVFPNRIDPDFRFAFQTLTWNRASDVGMTYDTGSVMQSKKLEYSLSNQLSIRPRANSAILGSTLMSENDQTALRRLYSCPGAGKPGSLLFLVNSLQNVPDVPRVLEVTGIDADGRKQLFTSRIVAPGGNLSMSVPSGNWQFFKVALDGIFGGGSKRRLILDSIVVPETNRRISRDICRTPTNCSRKMDLLIDHVADLCVTDPCDRANPRHHVASCVNIGSPPSRFQCVCLPGYIDSRCTTEFAPMKVKILNARNLPDRDRFGGSSDSYVRIVARTSVGAEITKFTRVISSHNPVYNEEIEFPGGHYNFVKISAWDSDGALRGSDDLLVPEKSFSISLKRGKVSLTTKSCSGCNSEAHVNFEVTYPT